ncbi:MAG: hypothetical protein ACI4HL_04015 [Ruminococcus sp.]
MEGKIVIHKTFGEGKIISLKDNLLTVRFKDKESVFIFPECFEGVLTTADKELDSYAKMIINNKRLEKKLLQKKGLNRRLLQTRRNVPRWHSYIPDNRKNGGISSPKNKAETGIKRYEGKNYFAMSEGENFMDFIENNEIIIPIENNNIASIIKKGDLLFCIKDGKAGHIGIVLSNPTVNNNDDNTDEYIITAQFIPVMAEVMCTAGATEDTISHIDKDKAETVLESIAEKCPYIKSIEGVV